MTISGRVKNLARAIVWQVLQIAALVLVAVSFLKVVQHFRIRCRRSSLTEEVQQTDRATERRISVYYAKAINDAQEAFVVCQLKDNNPE